MGIKNTYFLDESSINCGMTRLYGRAYSNERIEEYVPDVRFERTSMIGAMGVKGIIAPMTYKGTLNGEFFGAYVKECLAPVMKKRDRLVLDNLSVHKVKRALKPLVDKGVKIEFLPSYSQDMNLIENAWSKIKAYLRKEKARTTNKLSAAIALAFDTITITDIMGWINHCGYRLP